MNKSPMDKVIIIVGLSLILSSLMAGGLAYLKIPQPAFLDDVIKMSLTGLLGLLANPRSGMESRSGDTIRTETIETESLEVSGKKK